MATTKTTTLTFCIELVLKEALLTTVNQKYRSITNMIEVLTRDYCERYEIAIGEQVTPRRAQG